MTQPFLEAGEGGEFIACFDIDHPVHRQSGCLQSRRKQILGPYTPEDLSLNTRHDAGGKKSRHGTIQCAITGAGNFMQGPERQSAAGQAGIDLR